jgi:hypothetical protein
MWEDLASVRGVVDLSPQEALDSAQNFLIGQGYDVTHRTATTLAVARQDLGSTAEQHGALRMVVVAVPQPEGGVRIKVSGNDREGVRERQAEWAEWSEGLPKRQSPPPVREATAPVPGARHQRVDRTKALESLSGSFNMVKFWVISGLITGVSILVLPGLLRDISESSEPGDTLLSALLLVIAVFGVCLLPFALWQHFQRERFFQWLEANWTSLEKGVMHPEGYIISLDTKLIQYRAVFSAIFATVSFASRPYAFEHRSAGAAQIIFTVLSAVFGWWFIGLDGVVSTSQAIYGNMRNSGVFTLRDLAESSQARS